MLFFLSPWSPLEVTFLKKYISVSEKPRGGMAMITNVVVLVVESSSHVFCYISFSTSFPFQMEGCFQLGSFKVRHL